MKLSQSLTLIYLGLGIVAGYISNYLQNLVFSILAASTIYLISYLILIKGVKHKKKEWLLSNTITLFILVWLLVWIFLFQH